MERTSPEINRFPIPTGLDANECLAAMVKLTADTAADHGLDWVIFTEHAAWLGQKWIPRECIPLTGICGGPFPRGYHYDKAESVWGRLRSVTTARTKAGGPRLLLGQDLGTAAVITLSCRHYQTGHFAVYYTPQLINDGVRDCDEPLYLDKVQDAGGWGGINHPENGDGGSDWHCYFGDDHQDLTIGSSEPCGTGMVDRPGQAKTMEVINATNMPTDSTLRNLDAVLSNGARISAVGGGDEHTAGREWHGGAKENSSDGKIGLVGRTFVRPTGRIDVAGPSFSSTDPQDPVREAISSGRTVASNGPLGIVQVDGTFPGDTAEHDRTKPLEVRVDWNRSSFRTYQPSEDSDGPVTYTHKWIDEDPEVVRIVVGPTDSDCGSDRSACAALTETETVYLTAADKRRGYIVRTVEPSSSNDLWVRSEVLYERDRSDSDFEGGDHYMYGAFSSPIYVIQYGGAHVPNSGCRDEVLPANDDDSTDLVSIPFGMRFGSRTHHALYVNNNGNVSFDAPYSNHTPWILEGTRPAMIAPFFADVDTGNPGSNVTSYGMTTHGGRRAFCVDWSMAGHFPYATDKLNSFQLLIVDRSDVSPGDFDIIFNYETIQWETGSASGGSGGMSATVGYTAGDGEVGIALSLPGSGQNGAFLDSGPYALVGSGTGGEPLGRYVFEIRGGPTDV